MAKVVTATYESREDAERATERLIASGLLPQEISMLAPTDNGGSCSFSIEPHKRTLAGIGGGALLGLIVGALCGAALALFPAALWWAEPWLGQLPFEPAGIGLVASALIGAGAGAAAGGLLGALVGLFRTEHEAVLRHSDAERVGSPSCVLVGVAVPQEMLRSAVKVLAHEGAYKIKRG